MISKHLVTMFEAAGALTLGGLGAFGAAAFLVGLAFGISIAAGFLTGDLVVGAGLLATGAEVLTFAGAAPLPGCFMKVLKTALGKRWNFKPPTRPMT
jgi:hypothetical protein